MLNRFRNMVKRLELPEEERDVVHRIIDENFSTVEVSPAQYAIWSMQNYVTQKAIVGQDSMENVRVRTTFSIMPENRNSMPFGTHAFDMTSLEPLTEYSRRYDTWREAERGHQETLERIRRDYAQVRAVEERADALAGAIGEVRLAISADLPALFQAEQRSGSEVSVLTPLIRADGTLIEVLVSAGESEFTVTALLDASPGGSSPALANMQPETLDLLCTALGVSVESGTLTCREGDSSQLGRALIRVAQAVACLSYLAHGSR